MNELSLFIVNNMTLIYFRGLLSIVVMIVSQINLFLDFVIDNNSPIEGFFFLSLLLRTTVLGVVDGTEENELAWTVAVKVLVAVITTPVLSHWSTLIAELSPRTEMD